MAENKNALVAIVEKEKNNIWDIRASYLPKNIDVDTYFKRSLLSVFESNQMQTLAKTENGARSIFDCLRKSLMMGLQIGGHIPQAYLLPFGDRAELCPTAAGYKFIALSEPAVLKTFDVKCVYDGEDFSIDFATSEIVHKWDGKTERGKLIGVYGKWLDLYDETHVDFMSLKQIEHIRTNYSKQPNGQAWSKSYDEMAMKVASKKFLKPYAGLKEGLALSLGVDDSFEPHDEKTGDIASRASARLENVIETTATITEEKKIDEPKEKTDNTSAKTNEKKGGTKNDKDLFD